ncbi:60S ribosomal protein L35a-3, partial [Linum perenne]
FTSEERFWGTKAVVWLGKFRSKSNQYPNTSLIQIEGLNTKEDVTWYQGKRLAYIYKAKVKTNGSHYRCIWGKVTRPHGNSGVVRAKFTSNLPPKSMVSCHCLHPSVLMMQW